MVKRIALLKYFTKIEHFFRILIVGSRSCRNGQANDVCFAKLRLISMKPTYMKTFPVYYSLGLMTADGAVEHMTEIVKASSSDLIAIFGNEIEVFTRSKLMANKTRFLVNEALTIVCQVRR
jgi:hypothetical protein